MGHVTVGDKPLENYSDGELAAWLTEQAMSRPVEPLADYVRAMPLPGRLSDGDVDPLKLLAAISCGWGRPRPRPRGPTLALWAAILRAFDEVGIPQTVRQVFYALTTRGHIGKTEQGYRQVAYRILQMRRLGLLPYSFVADNTRWMRKPTTYDSLADALAHMQSHYRRSLWADQSAYVEIWIEKDALAGVVYDVTAEYDVPLMVTRGFPSESFVYEAAQNIQGTGKPAYLYYFGDFDPSGVSISDNLARKVEQWAPGTHFERKAVTAEQVKSLGLPTRPTKRTDTRARYWRGDSVELDAMPADVLRAMVKKCITRHIDDDVLRRVGMVEAAERETLAGMLP
jgi:hypothetical protein